MSNMKNTVGLISTAICLALLNGCSSMQVLSDPDYAPVTPILPPLPTETDGSIYHASTNRFLFEDIKARRIGDTITVILQESTDASKSAKTSASKEVEFDVPGPTVFGRAVTKDGQEILVMDVESGSDFSGEGDSSQSNSLSGSITVTVVDVLANTNLVVRGEKLLTLNQGSEVIRISGIVRPIDITTQNTIMSTQIAAAEITYSGNGIVANSNKPGWFTRFFNTVWPF